MRQRRVVDLQPHEVGRDIEDDRPPLQRGTPEGGRDVLGHGARRAELLETRPGRQHELPLRHILEVVAILDSRVATHEDHGQRRLHALDQRRHGVGQRRAVRHCGNPDTPGSCGIAKRHQGRADLMGRGDEPAALEPDIAVRHVEIGVADQPEHRPRAIVDKRLRQRRVERHCGGHVRNPFRR